MKAGSREALLQAVNSIPDAAFSKTAKITVVIDDKSIEVKYEPPIPVFGGA